MCDKLFARISAFLLCIVLITIIISYAGAADSSEKAISTWGDIKFGNNSGKNALLAPSSSLTELQINQKILDEARKWNERWGGQCKEWAQKVVRNATGIWIPTNYQDPRDSYHLAKWNPSSNVKEVWKGCFVCPMNFPNVLQPGHIIQLRWQKNFMNGGPHTVIIESVSPTSMVWLNSNWSLNNDQIVKRNSFNLNQWWKNIEAWTVYQIVR